MKVKFFNILLISGFILTVILADYIFIGFGKINPNNYKNNSGELEILKNENEQLKNELNQIKSLNELEKYSSYNYLKSQILLRDVYNFHETITILYGQDKQIKKGMAVVGEKGLIGIVSKVNKKTSVVKLLTAKDTRISVKIDESFGALDDYDLKKDCLIASNFNNYELIMKDEDVYTSGLGLMPEGIYIGKVQSTKDVKANIAQKVYIKSENNFNKIKYIAIIKGMKEL